jgi:hypothetical protein
MTISKEIETEFQFALKEKADLLKKQRFELKLLFTVMLLLGLAGLVKCYLLIYEQLDARDFGIDLLLLCVAAIITIMFFTVVILLCANDEPYHVRRLRRSIVTRRVHQILQKEWPWSLDEYRFIFPGGCPKCGYRTFLHGFVDLGDCEAARPEPIRKCLRCSPGEIPRVEGPRHWYHKETWEKRPRRDNNSPYMSRKRASKIPDFPSAGVVRLTD